MREARPTRPWYAVPVAVWAAAHLAAHAAGFAMEIPWSYYQLLDLPWLAWHPGSALCALHSQPPGLNTLLAGVLAGAGPTGVSAVGLAHVVFAGLELLGLLAVFHLVRALTGSPLVASAAVVVVVANPGHHVFTHVFFYEGLVAALLVLALVAAHAFLRRGGTARLAAVAVLLAAIANLRSLFHPVWAFGTFALLVALRGRAGGPPGWGGTAAIGCLLAALLAAWPLKNLVALGHFTGASMSAYSMARGVPGCEGGAALAQVPPERTPEVLARATRWCGVAAGDPLTMTVKGDGSRNWNHVTNLVRAPHLSRCAAAWRRQHPDAWLRRAIGQYAMWTRATFEQPYTGAIVGPARASYQRYAEWYRSVVFRDLRPWIEPATPGWPPHAEAAIRGRPVPYTVFGVVILPALLAAAVVRLWRRPWTASSALVVGALACLLWPMAAACLSDGQEGNRMRASSAGVLVVVAAWALAPARRRPGVAGGDPPAGGSGPV